MSSSKLCWPTPNGLPALGPSVILAASVLLLGISASAVELDLVRLFTAIPRMLEFGSHLLVLPDWEYLPTLGVNMLQTIEMTFLATSIALVISLPLGVLAAVNASPHPAVFHATRNVLTLMRALPELVWALVFVSAVGLGPLPGIMALSFVTVGFMGKFFAESIEVIDPRQIEGVAAHGAGWLQLRTFAFFPQAFPDFVGTVMYILDHNLRAAAILGLVGAGGIGYDLVMAMRMFDYDRLLPIALSIYVVVTVLDRMSDKFRRRLI
ncbi:MAG: phosphonate ABC transporter, permease protein PhnE [Gallionella sp.]|nr:phosphonate ABC transporter, permease protein PhnE [Gallionella sp.]OIO76263.1 MAG: phosphonate ABC transporter, permease protein PhnE [Gallionellaceae bacterium CG1_02_56_997]PIV47867.1 MAG: phosphonate ABC transporter, permease protein PhnE [Gallionellaceae bacterium CG02_land_8_20_14_3_00_60_115]